MLTKLEREAELTDAVTNKQGTERFVMTASTERKQASIPLLPGSLLPPATCTRHSVVVLWDPCC